jgi:hypothetical protein
VALALEETVPETVLETDEEAVALALALVEEMAIPSLSW